MEITRGTGLACEGIQEELFRLFEDELPPGERMTLESHLKHCPRCRTHWEEYVKTVSLLQALEPLDVPSSVMAGVREQITHVPWWRRAALWLADLPKAVPAPAYAAMVMIIALSVVFRMDPTFTDNPVENGPSPIASLDTPIPTLPTLDAIQSARWSQESDERALPGLEELMRPMKTLQKDMERRLMTPTATLQDDIVLDVKGSEEVFNRIKELLREVHGQMSVMGIRHRSTQRVIRSRIVLQVPLKHFDRVVEDIESLGTVHHLFVERDSTPMPPDRLRIRILAVDSLNDRAAVAEALQDVSIPEELLNP